LVRPEDVREWIGREPVLWINVDGLGDAATIEKLGAEFGLHMLALEDVVNTHQRPKVDIFDNCLFIVSRMADLQLSAATEQLSMFVGPNFVITLQEEAGDCWEPVRERIRKQVGRIRQTGPDYLAYSLLDAVIDSYFPVLEHYGERLDELEETVVNTPNRRALDGLHALKSEMLLLRRAIRPHREALAELARDSTPLVTEPTRIYLRDCYDHVIQLTDLVDTYRELTADLRDLYMSSVSNRINETMRVLTIISTIFIPITFIASIYGMNFKHMPETETWWGYPASLVAMGLCGAGMIFYFWWQGWLRSVEAVAEPKRQPQIDEHERDKPVR
jgi:magnesium transporter